MNVEPAVGKPPLSAVEAMTKDNNIFKYYHGRLPHWRRPGALYYLTLNTDDVELNDSERKIVFDALKFLNGKKYVLLCCTVMPDHAHLICFIGEKEKPDDLSGVVKSIKGYTAREINKLRDGKGTVWQREFFNRILRGDYELREKVNYIYKNPKVADLVDDPEEYSFWWFNEEYFEKLK